ncbi:MAG: PadR family transcriptional regulator [Pseudomonadota bacterium]
MSLQHILLGMLSQPSSGYDLKKTFEQQLRHYWSADLAQIYPTLNRLESKGLLLSEQQASDKGPPRRIYARTEAGHRALIDWLESGPDVSTDRLSWLAQVGFLHQAEPKRQLRFLHELRDEFSSHRQELQLIEDHWRQHDPRFPDQLSDVEFYAHCTLRLGLMKYATIVDWCDQCLHRLQTRQTI